MLYYGGGTDNDLPLNWIYQLGVGCVTWLGLVPWQLLQILRGRAGWRDLRERMCCGSIAPERGAGRILMHAVSAGEMAAAEPVIRSLAEMRPEIEIVLTTCCADGRAMAGRIQARCDAVRGIGWLPWDRGGAIRRWLSKLQPGLVVVVETEIWPGLFFACRELDIPLCIINGRIYQEDVWRYRLARPFFRRVLGCASWIGAQSEAEVERFCAIGANAARIDVIGNPKYAFVPRAASGDPRIAALGGAGTLIIAGSTHEPEEAAILRAFVRLRHDFPELRLLLAPRKVERSASLNRLVTEVGLRPVSWVAWGGGADWDVMILDQLGWLAEVYGCGRMAVIGGTFMDHGGQNPIEAAAHGIPVIMGPSSRNFAEIACDLEAGGGMLRLRDADGLEDALRGLLGDPQLASKIGAAAQECVRARQGISQRYATALFARMRVR